MKLTTYNEWLNENQSPINEGSSDPRVKKEAISRLSDFFRVPASNLSSFNFDGKDNIKALTKALNSTSDEGTEMYYKVAIKLAMEEVGVHESLKGLNEGAIKAFEMDYTEMVKQIKSGFGWIDPTYVEDTWEEMNLNSVDFSIVRDEVFNRLIKAGLLYYSDPNDPESKGKKVTNISQIK
jgi:hypothetical protein